MATTQITGTTALADAALDSSAADTNRGSVVNIFNVNGLTGVVRVGTSYIPGGNLTRASIFMYGAYGSGGNRTVQFFRVLPGLSWGEDNCTWNNYDGTNPWNTAGCAGSGTDFEADASPPTGLIVLSTYSEGQLKTEWFESWRDSVYDNEGMRGFSETGGYGAAQTEQANPIYFEVDTDDFSASATLIHLSRGRIR